MPRKDNTQHLKELPCKICNIVLPAEKFYIHKSKARKQKYRTNTCHKCYLEKKYKNRAKRKAKLIADGKIPNFKQDLQRLRDWKEKHRGTIEGFIYSNLCRWRKRSIEKCNIKSDLTFDYLIKLWHDQKGKCYYLQTILDPLTPKLGSRKQLSKSMFTMLSPSLDRINPKDGYTQKNVVWCSHAVNSMKGDLTKKGFIKICQKIASTNLDS